MMRERDSWAGGARTESETEHSFIVGDRVRRTGPMMQNKRREYVYRVVRLDNTGPYVWIVPESPTPTDKNERCVTEAYLELVSEPPAKPPIAGGTLGEQMARDNWLALYDKATKQLDEAGSGAIFNAMFAGNEWDLVITFRRFDKGELARNIEQARAAAAVGETLSPDELDQRLDR